MAYRCLSPLFERGRVAFDRVDGPQRKHNEKWYSSYHLAIVHILLLWFLWLRRGHVLLFPCFKLVESQYRGPVLISYVNLSCASSCSLFSCTLATFFLWLGLLTVVPFAFCSLFWSTASFITCPSFTFCSFDFYDSGEAMSSCSSVSN